MPGTTVLALDLGTRTGFAVGHDHVPQSGTWDLRPRGQDSPGMRYLYLRGRLEAVRQAYPSLAIVVYEQPYGLRGAAAQVLPGLVATLQAWCAEHHIEHTSVTPSALKTHATGKGNAGKPAMIEAARRKFGQPVHDDNEADALWLLDLASTSLLGPGSQCTVVPGPLARRSRSKGPDGAPPSTPGPDRPAAKRPRTQPKPLSSPAE